MMTTTTNGTGTTRLDGVVASVNERGIRLQGHADWLNFSKRAGAIAPPTRGQAVTVTLDGQGFVRAVEPLDGPPDAPGSAVAGREAAIIRQTCVKAAAAFCAARPELKSAELFALAERMERWVTR